MLVNNYIFKRISAYFIDFMIVAFIAAIFSEIAILNPYYDEYYETYESYNEFIEENENITDEQFLIKLKDYTYDIAKYGVFITVISFIVSILYYSICQYYTGGRSLGKALFKLKIVSKNNKNPSLLQMVVRTFIINNIFVYLLDIICIFLLSKNNCLVGLSIVETFNYFVFVSSITMILFRKDKRGLHDLISGTRVIDEKCKQMD